MAGELAMVERETDKSVIPAWQWRWRASYSRCFSYPSSYLSSNNNQDNPLPLSLSSLDRKNFKPTWLSTAESATVELQPSDQSPHLSILTVSLNDTILEEHHVSKLHFAWPQVSCLSGFPSRGSLAVVASYIDSSDEKQKFALMFATPSDVENFIMSMEDICSNRLPKEPAADVVSPISSQSEFIPTSPYRPDTTSMMTPICAPSEPMNHPSPYRPDTTRMMTPICAPPEPKNLPSENQQESQFQTHSKVADSEINDNAAFPPRFTSLVSSCSAEPEQGSLALSVVPELHQQPGLNSQIERYMQDASFLDMVSKVNEVITQLGGDYSI